MLFTFNEVKTYTFKEFKEIQENRELINTYSKEDIQLVNKMIDHIKKNKYMYLRLVFTTALMLHFNAFVFANGLDGGLDSAGTVIVSMFLSVMKWGCMGRGLYEMAMTMINGGNMRQAITEGLQFFLGFIFCQFYPQLYELFAGIKF